MKHVYATQRPETFEKIKEDAIRYRWDISSVPSNEEGEGEFGYVFNEVIVYEPISANKIFEKVITSLYPGNYEHKLVNEYNTAQLGICEEEVAEEYIQAYRNFLVERNELKIQVENDCSRYNIL